MIRLILLFFLLSPIVMVAQNQQVNLLIDEGIDLHDQGFYHDAIIKFSKALEIDPHSPAALYEMAHTWYTLTDYAKSIEYSKQVVDMNELYWIDAVILYGSALDRTDKSTKAMKLFLSAEKKYPTHALLKYNIALSYFADKQYDKAQSYVVLSLQLDKSDASAHLLLANTMLAQGHKLQCMLSLYYFLIIEQDSDRSIQAYELLEKIWLSLNNPNWAIDDKARINSQDPYKIVEFALSKGQFTSTDHLTLFKEKSVLLFDELTKVNWDKDDFWVQNYIVFFNEIQNRKLSESYIYYISNCKYNADVLKWISRNQSTFSAFINWMEKQ